MLDVARFVLDAIPAIWSPLMALVVAMGNVSITDRIRNCQGGVKCSKIMKRNVKIIIIQIPSKLIQKSLKVMKSVV